MTAHPDFLKYVNEHADKFIQRLAAAVQIKRYPIVRVVRDPI